MDIVIFGAGAWGTALAVNLSVRHRVALWTRDAAQAQLLAATRENLRYLPGVGLPAKVDVRCASAEALGALDGTADVVVIATAMAGLRDALRNLRQHRGPVTWLCKGFEAPLDAAHGLLGHEIKAAVAPVLKAGVLSGPSFAQEVARGQPTALVAASDQAEVRDALVTTFHGNNLRVYANDDLPGVEVGGAVKNVMAIACGLCDGLGLGLNARAALITRGLTEMTRLGMALGARQDTFMGLSGLGDLVLTATGDLSRNRKVGLALAQGRSLKQVLDALGHVVEGVYCARTVVQRAEQLGVDMPIARAVVALIDGTLKPAEAVSELMGRSPVSEGA